MFGPSHETVELKRDCPGIKIPDGVPVDLYKGTRCTITQSLGDTYTVVTSSGAMVRIDGVDADALGKTPIEKLADPANAPQNADEMKDAVWEKLRGVFDPEIPVSVVELGLVYNVKITPVENKPGRFEIYVEMTLTAPGCGMGDVLRADAQKRILSIPGASAVDVLIVLEPPWDRSMMSDAAKLELGMF